MQDLTLTLIQADLAWEDPQENLRRFNTLFSGINSPTHLILLPEMFTTGFSMKAGKFADIPDGEAMRWMKEKARDHQCVVAGSILTLDQSRYFNRFVWVRPDGSSVFYDKKHSFSMGGEHKIMTAGTTRTLVDLHGWKISLQVCYDLRFPVWSRNRYDENGYAYDVLVYVANWPEVRRMAYQRLLPARAIENQSYVAWVNRVGNDGGNIYHSGDSGVYDPEGNILALADPGTEQVLNVTLSADTLLNKRKNFHIGPDWDSFSLNQ